MSHEKDREKKKTPGQQYILPGEKDKKEKGRQDPFKK